MNSKIINIPNNWNEVTVGNFIEILSIINSEDTKLYSKELAIVNVLSNNNLDAKDIPYTQLTEILSSIKFIENKVPIVSVKDSYIINGNEYSLCKNKEDLSAAQFIDLVESNGDIVKQLTAVLVPINKSYNTDYKLKDVAYDIENHLSIVEANSISFFFASLLELQLQLLMDSLMVDSKTMDMQKMSLKQQKLLKELTSESSGNGLYVLNKLWL